jgi:hypothetical protein
MLGCAGVEGALITLSSISTFSHFLSYGPSLHRNAPFLAECPIALPSLSELESGEGDWCCGNAYPPYEYIAALHHECSARVGCLVHKRETYLVRWCHHAHTSEQATSLQPSLKVVLHYEASFNPGF